MTTQRANIFVRIDRLILRIPNPALFYSAIVLWAIGVFGWFGLYTDHSESLIGWIVVAAASAIAAISNIYQFRQR